MRILLVVRSLNAVSYKSFVRYAQELFSRLRKYHHVDALEIPLDETAKGFSKEKQALLPFRTALRLLGKRAKNYDIVHAIDPMLGAVLPIFTSRSIVTFHDLVPLTLPGHWRWEWAIQAYFSVVYNMAAKAGMLLANSSQTAAELVTVLGVNKGKVRVVSLGVDGKFRPLERPRRLPTLGFLGNLGPRKRADYAIRVYRILRDRGFNCQLIIAGGEIPEPSRHEHRNQILRLSQGIDGIKLLGHVPEDDMVNLYNSFDLFLCTSDTEGLGLPILESQRCGVPVLVRKDARIPQEVTKAAVVCDSPEDMASKAARLLSDADYYEKVRQAGLLHSSAFTWDSTAEGTLQGYHELLRRV